MRKVREVPCRGKLRINTSREMQVEEKRESLCENISGGC
jgi:hypothetical protein